MNIVNGVVQLAQVITRRSMTIRMQSRLMDYVLELVQNELDKLEVVVEE
jgi:GTP cyclohydrolase I